MRVPQSGVHATHHAVIPLPRRCGSYVITLNKLLSEMEGLTNCTVPNPLKCNGRDDARAAHCTGADGGNRTHTPNREEDFKSSASTVPPRPRAQGNGDGSACRAIPLPLP